MADFILIVDGGCSPNPGPGYYSYRVTYGEQQSFGARRMPIEWATNNEAEYTALLEALRAIEELFGDGTSEDEIWSRPLSEWSVTVKTDSRLLAEQVRGNWKVKADNLRPYVKDVRDRLRQFKEARIDWVPRGEIVKWLGH